MKLRLAKKFYIISSVLTVLMGLVFLIFPEISLSVICRISGIIIILVGISKIFGYFSDSFYNIAFQFDFALGILTTAVGVIFVIFPELILAYIAVVLSIIVIVNAIFTIQNSLEAKKFGIAHWWALLISAVPALVIGILSLLNPFEAGSVITVFLGIALILDGIQNIVVAIIAVKIKKKNMYYEVID